MAIVNIEQSVTVPADARAVTAFLADARNDVRWKGGIVSSELTAGDRVVETSVFRISSKMMGMKNTVDVTLTRLDPAGRVEFTSADAVVKTELRYDVETVPEGSRVTLNVRLQAAGPIANMAGRMLRAQVPKDMERLPLQFGAGASG